MAEKKMLFSTRSYRLRKWLEEQYNPTVYKSESSNSYYYTINYDTDKKYKIRISDHFPVSNKGHIDYNIVIAFDPHDINKNVYVVSIKNYENNVITINDFRELKYDINHGVIYAKIFNDVMVANQKTLDRKEQLITTEQAKKVNIEGTQISDPSKKSDALEYKNAPNRTTSKYWGSICCHIPGWQIFDKQIRKAITDLMKTSIDFNDACEFIINNSTQPKAKFIVAIYKKRNEMSKL